MLIILHHHLIQTQKSILNFSKKIFYLTPKIHYYKAAFGKKWKILVFLICQASFIKTQKRKKNGRGKNDKYARDIC